MTVAFLANVSGLCFMVTFLAHFTFSFRFISFFPLYSREWHDSLEYSVAVNHFCREHGSQHTGLHQDLIYKTSLHKLLDFPSVFTLLRSRNCLGSHYLVWQSLGPCPVSLCLIFQNRLLIYCVHADVWKSGSRRAKEGKSLFSSKHVLPTQLVWLGSR